MSERDQPLAPVPEDERRQRARHLAEEVRPETEETPEPQEPEPQDPQEPG